MRCESQRSSVSFSKKSLKFGSVIGGSVALLALDERDDGVELRVLFPLLPDRFERFERFFHETCFDFVVCAVASFFCLRSFFFFARF